MRIGMTPTTRKPEINIFGVIECMTLVIVPPVAFGQLGAITMLCLRSRGAELIDTAFSILRLTRHHERGRDLDIQHAAS